MILTTSFGFKKNTFYKQIDYAKEYNFSNVIFKDDYKNLIRYSDDELKEMYDYARANKVSVIAIDTYIKPFKLKDSETIKVHYDKYVELIRVAKMLRVKDLFMTLPKVSEIVVEHDAIKKALTPLHELITKERVNVSFKPNNIYNVYAYIFHQRDFKNFYFYYDVAAMFKHKSSLPTSYRLLKDFMKFVVINDIDDKKRPILVPHGITEIKDLLEQMKKDNYKDYGVLDPKLINILVEERKKPLWARISKKWFKKGDPQDQLISTSSNIMNPHSVETKEALASDVIDYSIDYLSKYFRIRR